MNTAKFNRGLLAFLKASPTPFHAVAAMAQRLLGEGFRRLDEGQAWQLAPGGRYFVTRNDSALVAFSLGGANPAQSGLRMAGAHTDSPCLKLKPQPLLAGDSYCRLGVEVYGGALFAPWFDRDLSLAGRVSCLGADNRLHTHLVDFRDPVAVIPSLAIHLDREVNKHHEINPQKELPPLLLQDEKPEKIDFRRLLLARLLQEKPDCGAREVLDFELSLYDTQPPALVGLNQDFIAGARLDNLLSCYTGLTALTAAGGQQPALLVLNDHEEVGSASAAGAQGPFLRSVLKRICPCEEDFSRMVSRSLLISIDNAHGLHPNYRDKYDDNHGPRLNRGPVIKTNANQRYASNSQTAAVFRLLARRLRVPVQDFVVRSDMACGSTIGPLTAAEIGVRTLDVGVPTLAMHSIRELAGSRDGFYLFKVLQAFFRLADIQTIVEDG
jgi:aspartyl aminopeptidase